MRHCPPGIDPLVSTLLVASAALPAISAARGSGTVSDSSHRNATSIRLRDAASATGSCPPQLRRAGQRTRWRREFCSLSSSDRHRAQPVSAVSAPQALLLSASAVPPISVPAEAADLQKN